MQRLIALVILVCAGATAASEEFTLESHNRASKRSAYLVDNGKVAYLYLSAAGTEKFEKDAIAYSRVPPSPQGWELLALQNDSPPLSADVASDTAVVDNPRKDEFSFEWSVDGAAVVLLRGDNPLAFVAASSEAGYSKAVSKAFPLGNPWDEALYQKIFDPTGRDAMLRRAMARHDRGDPAGAVSLYEKILSEHGDDAEVLYEAGMSAAAARNLEACLGYAKRGLALKPEDPGGLYSLLGGCHDQLGNTADAVAVFDEGIRLSPDHVGLHFNYGISLMRRGDLNGAREHFRSAIDSAPGYATLYLAYGQLLDKEGNPGAAIAMYLRFLMLDASSPRNGEISQRIVELIRAGAAAGPQGKIEPVPLSIANAEDPDGVVGQALGVVYGDASSEWLRKQGKKGTEADHMHSALERYVNAAQKNASEEIKSSFIWSAGIGPVIELHKRKALRPFLYMVTAFAELEGGKPWTSSHAKDIASLLTVLAAVNPAFERQRGPEGL
jgi:Flp pilus assembly protein TadD